MNLSTLSESVEPSVSLWAFSESIGFGESVALGLSVSTQLVYGTSVSPWVLIVGICRALSESESPQQICRPSLSLWIFSGSLGLQ